MHKIIIKNLKLRCIIGINPDERKHKQEVVINMAIWADFSKAAKTDDIADTVNYRTLNKRVIRLVEGSRFNLLERLAGKIADECLECDAVEKVKVRVEKPGALRSAESVGVEITKGRA